MRFPFISREHHESVLAERERVIVALRAQIAMLERRMEQPVPVTVTLPEGLFLQQQAIVSRRKKKRQESEFATPDEKPVDLTIVEEGDLESCAALALKKYGRKPYNTWEMRQWIRGIQTEIRAAKSAKRRKDLKAQREQQAQDASELQKGIDLDAPIDESKIPAHILELVAQAEGGE